MSRILLIEPDQLLGNTLTKYLSGVGHTLFWERSGQAAIEQIDRKSPDLVLLQMQLPQHSGVEFLYEFRSYPEWQSIPVVVLGSVPISEVNVNAGAWQQLNVAHYHHTPSSSMGQLSNLIKQLLATPTAFR